MHEAPTARSASRRFAPATAVARFVTAAACCFGALLPPAPSRAQGGACPPDFGSGRLCTAADLRVTSVVVDGPSACTDGETISLDLLVGFTSTANERYDIGLFVADDGGEVIGGTSCTLGSLTPQTAVAPLFNGTDPAGLGPYRDLDGDACGDLQAPDGENFRRLTLDGVLCRDRDGDGDVDINGLVVWNQNANQGVCTDPGDPAQFFPDQSSKCELAPDYNLPITVEPEPAMVVEKRPFPEILLAPGGDVIFFVTVGNTSTDTDPLLLESLADDVHGDLDGRGTCSLPQVIAPGTSYACRFTAEVTGAGGDSETDTVTASAVDDEGAPVVAEGSATVDIIGGGSVTPPSLSVLKIAYPGTVTEPGGSVLYAVEVINTSDTEDVTIDSLEDDIYGDVFSLGDRCPTFAGVTLAPAERFICSFRATVPPAPLAPGAPGDTVTDVVTATGSSGVRTATDSDDATVTVIDSPSRLEAGKRAFPQRRPAPGGAFLFRLDVQNASPVDTVTIISIDDDVHGDLDGQGSCAVPRTLAPSEVYTCFFPSSFTGVVGEFQVDTIVVIGTDDDGGPVRATARAQVELTDSPANPALDVVKIAEPTALTEPGGNVTFTIEVSNASDAGDVTITSLVDDVYGDLDGLGSCTAGAVLTADAENDRYVCSFSVAVSGAGGDEIVNVVTARGDHVGGATLEAADDATVTILPVDSDLLVTKSASPRVLGAPGGDVAFTVTATNTGAAALEVLALTDSVYGDLAGRGNCASGAVVPPGEGYSCQFSAPVSGGSPTAHLDTVTVEARSTSGTILYDSARAIVLIYTPAVIGGPLAIPLMPLSLVVVTVAAFLGLGLHHAGRRPR